MSTHKLTNCKELKEREKHCVVTPGGDRFVPLSFAHLPSSFLHLMSVCLLVIKSYYAWSHIKICKMISQLNNFWPQANSTCKK